jgi:hypothetical protein
MRTENIDANKASQCSAAIAAISSRCAAAEPD